MSHRVVVRVVAALTILGWASDAGATPARVSALLSNPAFIDDSEVLTFPSYIGDIDRNATVTYSPTGSADASVSLAPDKLLWFGRGVPGSLAEGTGASPWQIVYGSDAGDTGKLFRSSWQKNIFSVGGAWSRGDFTRNGDSFAVSGDLYTLGALDGEGEDLEFAVDSEIRSRSLTEAMVKGWTARLSHSTTAETTYAGGFYSVGPRLSSGALRAALVTEPGLFLVNGSDDTALAAQLPGITLSAEMALNDWMTIRGAAQSRWLFNATDVSELTKTDKWSSSQTATMGLGMKKEGVGRLDFAVNPTWLVAGPHVLSGVSNPAFFQLSAQAGF